MPDIPQHTRHFVVGWLAGRMSSKAAFSGQALRAVRYEVARVCRTTVHQYFDEGTGPHHI